MLNTPPLIIMSESSVKIHSYPTFHTSSCFSATNTPDEELAGLNHIFPQFVLIEKYWIYVIHYKIIN
jgi:hypothetical protein